MHDLNVDIRLRLCARVRVPETARCERRVDEVVAGDGDDGAARHRPRVRRHTRHKLLALVGKHSPRRRVTEVEQLVRRVDVVIESRCIDVNALVVKRDVKVEVVGNTELDRVRVRVGVQRVLCYWRRLALHRSAVDDKRFGNSTTKQAPKTRPIAEVATNGGHGRVAELHAKVRRNGHHKRSVGVRDHKLWVEHVIERVVGDGDIHRL